MKDLRRRASDGRTADQRSWWLRPLLVVSLVFLALIGFGSVTVFGATDPPTISSDLADYNPGGTVTLTGANWDTGGAKVHIVVTEDNAAQAWQHVADVAPSADGNLSYSFQLPTYFVAQYSVQATQEVGSSTLSASTSFTDANPSATLDQCGNDSAPSPATDGCSASPGDWVNGNLGAS